VNGSAVAGNLATASCMVIQEPSNPSQSIWVCVECGQYTCRGVGVSITPYSHIVRLGTNTQHVTLEREYALREVELRKGIGKRVLYFG